MPKKIDEKIHIMSPARAYLAPAKVMGPIVHPLLVDKKVAVQILMSGAEVHEYLPQNKKTIKLTLANINDPHRYDDILPSVVKMENPTVELVKRNGVPNVIAPVDAVKVDVAPVEPKAAETVIDSAPADVTITEPETTPIDEVPQASDVVIAFEYNEDGTIDETKIEWAKYSKNQRKEIRAQINKHNDSLKA